LFILIIKIRTKLTVACCPSLEKRHSKARRAGATFAFYYRKKRQQGSLAVNGSGAQCLLGYRV